MWTITKRRDVVTDLETCKRIAEIEGIELSSDGISHNINFNTSTAPLIYNPLTDDALCFKLMIKYKITMNWHTDGYKAWVMIKAKSYSAAAKTANKAICLAIIEANKEKTQC